MRDTFAALLAAAALVTVVVFFGNGAFAPDLDKPISIIEMPGPRGGRMQVWCMPSGQVLLFDGREAAPMPEARCVAP